MKRRLGPSATSCAPALLALLVAIGFLACARAMTPEQRDRQLDEADRALAAGDVGTAEGLFMRAVEDDPGSARAAFGLALAHLRMGRTASALAQLERSHSIDEQNPDYALLRARTLAWVGRRSEAIEGYKALLAMHPERPQPWVEMLENMLDAGLADDALEQARSAVAKFPRQYRLLLLAGRAHGLTGDHAGSIPHYERARSIRPRDPQAIYGLIEAYRHTGRVEEGLALITAFEEVQARARQIEPLRVAATAQPASAPSAQAYLERLLETGHLDEAVEQAVSLLARLPSFPGRAELALRVARAAVTLGDVHAARQLLFEAGTIEESSPEALVDRAEVHEALGDLTTAMELYDSCLKQRPDDVRALTGKGRAAMGSGQLDSADPPIRRAVELRPDDAATRAALGLLLLRQGDEAAATIELREANRIDPRQPDALLGLGMLAIRHKDDVSAGRHLRAALEARPADGTARAVLALVLAKTGGCEEAVPLLTLSLDLDPGNTALNQELVRCLEETGRTAEAARARDAARRIE